MDTLLLIVSITLFGYSLVKIKYLIGIKRQNVMNVRFTKEDKPDIHAKIFSIDVENITDITLPVEISMGSEIISEGLVITLRIDDKFPHLKTFSDLLASIGAEGYNISKIRLSCNNQVQWKFPISISSDNTTHRALVIDPLMIMDKYQFINTIVDGDIKFHLNALTTMRFTLLPKTTLTITAFRLMP